MNYVLSLTWPRHSSHTQHTYNTCIFTLLFVCECLLFSCAHCPHCLKQALSAGDAQLGTIISTGNEYDWHPATLRQLTWRCRTRFACSCRVQKPCPAAHVFKHTGKSHGLFRKLKELGECCTFPVHFFLCCMPCFLYLRKKEFLLWKCCKKIKKGAWTHTSTHAFIMTLQVILNQALMFTNFLVFWNSLQIPSIS